MSGHHKLSNIAYPSDKKIKTTLQISASHSCLLFSGFEATSFKIENIKLVCHKW